MPPFRWTMVRKLQLLVLITILPAFAIAGFLSLADDVQRQRQNVQDRASREALDAADEVDTFIRSAGQVLAALAQAPAIRERNGEQAGTILARLLPEFRFYDNLIAYAPSGASYASGAPVSEHHLYAGDREYFKQTVSSGRLTVSTLAETTDTSEIAVVIAYPVQLLEETGVIVATIKPSAMRVILSADTRREASVTVVASSGHVIARTPDWETWVGKQVSLSSVNPDITRKSSGGWEGMFLDETPRLMAYHTSVRAPWRVFVGIPASEVYQQVKTSLIRGAAVFVVVFGFAMIVAVVLGRRWTAPLRRLARAAHEFSGERLPAPVPIEGQDEVAELSIAFNKMLADLKRQIDELSKLEAVREADILKTMLLSSVSHELKTPLGSIKGFASALQQEDVTLDRATQLDFLATIEADADRLTRLVEDILDMSRLETGSLQLSCEACSVEEIVQSTWAHVQHLLGKRSIEVSLPDDLPPVLVDPGRIERVLFNLIDNSIKYSPDETCIRIAAWVIPAEQSAPFAVSHMDSSLVAVSVEDEGIGIALEDKERVFERFYRAEASRRRHASGTGLGLAICRALIQLHGGRIWVEHRPDSGARFVFTIPVTASGATRQIPITLAGIRGEGPQAGLGAR